MKKLAFVFTFFFALIYVQAQQKVIPLYNGAAPGSEKWNWDEGVSEQNLWQTKIVFNVSKPTLTVFEPEPGKANGTFAREVHSEHCRLTVKALMWPIGW
jgi:hypothetical protein